MPRSASTTVRPRRSGGGGYVVLAVMIGGIAAAFIFGGNTLRELIGHAGMPHDEGKEPTSPAGASANVASVGHVDTMPTAAVAVQAAPVVVAAPVTPDAAPTTPTGPAFPDAAKAASDLDQANSEYKAYHWQAAVDRAQRVLSLRADPKQLERARDIASGAVELQKLFKSLDDRDELSRNFDTNPLLVQIGSGSSAIYAVAVQDDSADPVPVDNDPINYIKQSTAAGTKVWAMVKGHKDFILAQLPDDISQIRLVDQTQVAKNKQAEFDKKRTALESSALANSATAWYEAAKFAYRNRLDPLVTDLLDRALELDPNLVSTVREDKAGQLYANMVFHIKNNNKSQAAIFVGIIQRKYADTNQGKEAILYYNGKTQEMLAMAMADQQREKDEEAARIAARLQKAQESGDADRIAAAQKAAAAPQGDPVDDPATPDQPTDAPVSADQAAAEKAYNDGFQFYAQAQQLGAVPERNDLYAKAGALFSQSVKIYSKLLEKDPNNETLQTKMVEANKLRFGAEKYRTAF